ncbi:MAG: DUF1836 domain-containing protein [Lachnospiraceae bacterium]|nr:DUF1836 domain-containing protein [Lachnospiraceae bacterium]MDN4742208.1 DUF1836 domain-containing protein [Lachnospiraceae bacterium C1.1]
MTFNTENFVESILSSIDRMGYIKSDEIPNIELYMDQLTSFMEKRLANTRRNESDKIMTKTMINNYTKNDLLPPPERKRYGRDHIMMLLFIYYFKNILSMSDIKKLLGPLSKNYFNNSGELKLSDIYDEMFEMSLAQREDLKKFVEEQTASVMETCKGANKDNEDFLHLFAFICALGFDAYVKKLMIEKIIDLMDDDGHPIKEK